MYKRDDDDEVASRSNAEYFTRSDHGKEKQQERRAKEKGQLASLKRDVLRQQVNPRSMKDDEHDPARDAKQERENAKAAEKKLTRSFGPKSSTQAAKEEVETAQSQTTPDKSIKKEEQEHTAKDAAQEEYQQNMS